MSRLSAPAIEHTTAPTPLDVLELRSWARAYLAAVTLERLIWIEAGGEQCSAKCQHRRRARCGETRCLAEIGANQFTANDRRGPVGMAEASANIGNAALLIRAQQFHYLT